MYGFFTKDADGLPSILDFTWMDRERYDLFITVHHLLRVDRTPEKGGGNLT